MSLYISLHRQIWWCNLIKEEVCKFLIPPEENETELVMFHAWELIVKSDVIEFKMLWFEEPYNQR